MRDDFARDCERFCRLVEDVYGDGRYADNNPPAQERDAVRRLVGNRYLLPEECSVAMGVDERMTYDEAARRLIAVLEIAPEG
jgi:hypothetical protein